MTRRRLLLFAAAACLLLAAPFVVRWATTPEPGVTRRNFGRLHAGMTMDEIEAVLGRAADQTEMEPTFTRYTWDSDEGRVWIMINKNQPWLSQVPQGGFWKKGELNLRLAAQPWHEPLPKKLRRWLRL